MKKTIKGALAATAAGTLLLGGAGSLAYWTDTGTVGGGAVTSGHLKLNPTTAGAPCTAWTIDGTPGTFVPGTDKIVPGDVLTRTCSYTVSMAGKHVTANLAVSDSAGTWGGTANALTSGLPANVLQKSVVFKKGVATITPPVAIVNDDVISAVLTVTFPTTADNTTNVNSGLTATLNDITVTATQTHTP
ncbi:alternate-type signal peptide domain-containing protein [Nocardioides sp. cx-169]|uniref:alternate-type signal peptide domain-containing protein n=1 Tax=Nocardioides sp. cx-169 TaxID=2899080 RepID=UPI001E520D2F|nr:alternate-type signal peptide domain-containing protein [Nocardioides sp. cx-169]MCD4535088.1 alternate-type signal peptide domain-containing protein [Nocardioides sp. cx-169]